MSDLAIRILLELGEIVKILLSIGAAQLAFYIYAVKKGYIVSSH